MRNICSLWIAGVIAIAAATVAGSMRIEDDAGFFSARAIEQANASADRIKHDFGKDLVVETFASIPEDLRGEERAKGREQFYEDWLPREARRKGVNGVFILITRDPPHVQVGVGSRTRQKAFTFEDVKTLRDGLIRDFRQKKFDEGLVHAAEFVHTRMAQNLGHGGEVQPASHPDALPPEAGRMNESPTTSTDLSRPAQTQGGKTEVPATQPATRPDSGTW